LAKKFRIFIPHIIILLAGMYFFRTCLSDLLSYVIWWLCLAVMGILFLPVTDAVFGKFANCGYMFSKVFCLAAAGYLQWLLSTVRILPFRAWSCFLVLLVFAAANALLNRKTGTWGKYLRDNELLRRAGNQEALFMILLLFWTYLRALRPEIEGLEKFMDFGFLNSLLRSDWLPAPDMWLAGMNINYYYLGHFFTAFLTRLTFIDAAVTYNLMMATLFALSFMLAYAVAGFLVEIYQRFNQGKLSEPFMRRARVLAGVFAGLAVSVAGNLHTIIYGVLFPQWDVRDSYWFPSATRYIGYNPVVSGDRTIHEFPLYSFVVSDLHAHVINLPFVLTAIAVALSLAVHVLNIKRKDGDTLALPDPVLERKLRMPPALLKRIGVNFSLIILLVGLFPAINFWDYPIYIVFTGALLLYANLKTSSYSLKSLLVTVGQMIAVGVAAYIVTLPFQLLFDSMGASIKLVQVRSRLYQLGVLWGWQLFFALVMTYMMIRLYRKRKKEPLASLSPHDEAYERSSRNSAGEGSSQDEADEWSLRYEAVGRSSQDSEVEQSLRDEASGQLSRNEASRQLSRNEASGRISQNGASGRSFRYEASGRSSLNGAGERLLLDEADEQSLAAGGEKNTRRALFRFMDRVNPADAFVFIIFICAIGLFIIPELIYIADIYPSHPRANTMFKVGYQAFTLFGIGVGYTFTRLIFIAKEQLRFRRILLVVGSVLMSSALIYPFVAITQWYSLPPTGIYKGLDGVQYMLTDQKVYNSADDKNIWITLENDYALIQYLNENVKGSPVIAEAYGASYTLNGRISAATGLPNILNWYNHQLLWRNSNYGMLNERELDINDLYESGEEAHVREILRKYNVEYIVIGQIERLCYPEIDEYLLLSMGEIVSQWNDLYLIKVSMAQ